MGSTSTTKTDGFARFQAERAREAREAHTAQQDFRSSGILSALSLELAWPRARHLIGQRQNQEVESNENQDQRSPGSGGSE